MSIAVIAGARPSGTCSCRCLRRVHLEAHDFTEAGSEVVVSNTVHFRGREGIEVIASSGLVFTVENGQITRLRLFQERAEAFEAAGLSE